MNKATDQSQKTKRVNNAAKPQIGASDDDELSPKINTSAQLCRHEPLFVAKTCSLDTRTEVHLNGICTTPQLYKHSQANIISAAFCAFVLVCAATAVLQKKESICKS